MSLVSWQTSQGTKKISRAPLPSAKIMFYKEIFFSLNHLMYTLKFIWCLYTPRYFCAFLYRQLSKSYCIWYLSILSILCVKSISLLYPWHVLCIYVGTIGVALIPFLIHEFWLLHNVLNAAPWCMISPRRQRK